VAVPSVFTSDDEDEARGLATVLERAGILVELRDRGGALAVDVAPQHESKARVMLERLAGAHARKLDGERLAKRQARERWFVRAAWIGAAIAALVWLVIALG
jgi:hypothetical protein